MIFSLKNVKQDEISLNGSMVYKLPIMISLISQSYITHFLVPVPRNISRGKNACIQSS